MLKRKGRKSKKAIEAATKIQNFFRNEKERNKIVINIKNDDNNCFIYSVLCGYLDICDKSNPERVSQYANHLKLFKYEEKDMPMKIDKIMHFEKRNQLRINVFGIEENSIYP